MPASQREMDQCAQRRNVIQTLLALGLNTHEIAFVLKIPIYTVENDRRLAGLATNTSNRSIHTLFHRLLRPDRDNPHEHVMTSALKKLPDLREVIAFVRGLVAAMIPLTSLRHRLPKGYGALLSDLYPTNELFRIVDADRLVQEVLQTFVDRLPTEERNRRPANLFPLLQTIVAEGFPTHKIPSNRDIRTTCDLLDQTIEALTERQATVIRKRYGIGCETHFLREVGKEFSRTKERVRQLVKEALESLRPMTRPIVQFLKTQSLPLTHDAILDEPILVLHLPHRAVTRIRTAGIESVHDLLTMTEDDLLRLPGFGQRSLNEVKERLWAHHLSLRALPQTPIAHQLPSVSR